MVANEVEIQTQKSDKLIKCILKRIVNGLDNNIGLNIFS